MSTIYVIIIYVVISLLFLIVVGIEISIKSERKQKQFSVLFPKLLNHIRLEEYKKAREVFDKIKWNSNYTFFHYMDVCEVLKLSLKTKENSLTIESRKLLIEEINKNCKEKGWDFQNSSK